MPLAGFTPPLVITAKARAYLDSAQDIPHNVGTKVALDGETYDPGANFDIVNNRFVAPVAGIYSVKAALRYLAADVVAGKECGIWIYKNGADWAGRYFATARAETLSFDVSDDVECAVDDFIEVYTWHNFGDAAALANETAYTYLAVHLLSAS